MIPNIDYTSTAITPSRQITADMLRGCIGAALSALVIDILKVGNGPIAF